MDRRTFLKTGGAFMLGASLDPAWLMAADPGPAGRILIMIQLAGGNDGLNTVVPYSDIQYARLRPSLAFNRADLHSIDNGLALHPALGGLHGLYQKGNVAIVQGLGYPQPNRSHFVSTDIWHSAQIPPRQDSGWLGRLSDMVLPDQEACDLCCRHPLAYGTLLPLALRGARARGGCVPDFETFKLQFPVAAPDNLSRLQQLYRVGDSGDPEMVRQLTEVGLESLTTMAAVSSRVKTPVLYPYTGFAQFLRLTAQMIADGVAPTVFHAGIGGFDTHSGQREQQQRSLQVLGDGVAAFMQDLEWRGLDQRVVLATYSEFGRRVRENASRGTDHGAAGPHFLIGTPVRGGLYGPVPDLSNLVHGDIPFAIDFRGYYATLLESWLRCSSSRVLGATFPLLPVF